MKTIEMNEAGKRMLEQQRKKLVAELEALAPFCRGSLHPFSVKRDGKEWRYYSWEVGSGPRRASRTPRIEQAERIRLGIARRKAYEAWRKRYEETMETSFLALEGPCAVKKRPGRYQRGGGAVPSNRHRSWPPGIRAPAERCGGHGAGGAVPMSKVRPEYEA